jgi:uncharacterized phage infection (PIP) family protein YhgE
MNEASPFSAEDETLQDTSTDARRARPERWRSWLESAPASTPLVVEIARQLTKLRERVGQLEQQVHQRREDGAEQLQMLAGQVTALGTQLREQLVSASEGAHQTEPLADKKVSLEILDVADDRDKLIEAVNDQLIGLREFELRTSRAVDARFRALFEWTESRLAALEQACATMNLDVVIEERLRAHTEPLYESFRKLESVSRTYVCREEWSRDRDALEKRFFSELEKAINRNGQKVHPAEDNNASASVALDAMRSVIHLQNTVEGNARAVEDALSAIRSSYQTLNQRLQRMELQLPKDETTGRPDLRSSPSVHWSRLEQDIRRLEDQWQTLLTRLPDTEEIIQNLTRTNELLTQSSQLQRQVDGLQRQLDGERNQHTELCRRLGRLEELTGPLPSLSAELSRVTQSITQGDEALQEWARGQIERLDSRLYEHSSLLHELQTETEHLYQQYSEVAALILLMTPTERRAIVEQRIRQLMPGIASPGVSRSTATRENR